jgi:hypothetical protein
MMIQMIQTMVVKVNQTVMWMILVMYFDPQCNIPDKINNHPDDDSKDRSSNPMEGITEDSGMCASILMPSIHVNWQLFSLAENFAMEGIESQEGKNVIAFKN